MQNNSHDRRTIRVLKLIRWPFSAIRLLCEFTGMWLATRSLRSLVFGLPAGILLFGLPIVGGLGLAELTGDAQQRYQQLAQDAFAGDDFAAAELWTRKIIALQPENNAARYLLALTLEGQGDERRAQSEMKRLASQDETGFGPAHLWFAERLLNTEEPSADRLRAAIGNLSAAQRSLRHSATAAAQGREKSLLRDTRLVLAQLIFEESAPALEELTEARAHLQAILDEQRDDVAANFLMAQVLQRLGADREAVSYLRQIVAEHAAVRTQLAGIYLKLGDAGRAQAELQAARDDFREQLKQRPDDLNVRLRLANAHSQLGEFQSAADVLRRAMPAADAEGTPQLRAAWVSLCLASIAIELKRPEPDWDRILQVIDLGLSVSDDDPRLYEAIGVVINRNQDVELTRLRTVLEHALAAGRAPATCHLLLGSVLGATGELEQGIGHLQTALQEYPDHPIISNNLAMLLLRKDPPQPEEALRLADLAVAAAPHLAAVRDTRGQALFALGRYDEALPELEKAIDVEEDRALRHTMLAEIYERRGDTRMADQHRRRAETSNAE